LLTPFREVIIAETKQSYNDDHEHSKRLLFSHVYPFSNVFLYEMSCQRFVLTADGTEPLVWQDSRFRNAHSCQ